MLSDILIAAAAAISHFAPPASQARSRRAAAAQVLWPPREGKRPLFRTIAHGISGGVGAAPTAGSGASRPASATLCRGDPAVRRRTARLPRASVRRDEPPRLPPWLRRRPSRRARRDRSRVRGLTDISRPRVRLSDPRLPFPRRHHRHGRRRPRGTRGTSRPPWRRWPLPRRRRYPPHRWRTATTAGSALDAADHSQERRARTRHPSVRCRSTAPLEAFWPLKREPAARGVRAG